MKDFGVIENRKKEDLIMIDNFMYSFALDLDNGIVVKSYMGENDDKELEFLAGKLMELKNFEDSRVWIKKVFKTEAFYKYLRETSI
jgi:TFIIF-interacting CTD phosphatase-like protein